MKVAEIEPFRIMPLTRARRFFGQTSGSRLDELPGLRAEFYRRAASCPGRARSGTTRAASLVGVAFDTVLGDPMSGVNVAALRFR